MLQHFPCLMFQDHTALSDRFCRFRTSSLSSLRLWTAHATWLSVRSFWSSSSRWRGLFSSWLATLAGKVFFFSFPPVLVSHCANWLHKEFTVRFNTVHSAIVSKVQLEGIDLQWLPCLHHGFWKKRCSCHHTMGSLARYFLVQLWHWDSWRLTETVGRGWQLHIRLQSQPWALDANTLSLKCQQGLMDQVPWLDWHKKIRTLQMLNWQNKNLLPLLSILCHWVWPLDHLPGTKTCETVK